MALLSVHATHRRLQWKACEGVYAGGRCLAIRFEFSFLLACFGLQVSLLPIRLAMLSRSFANMSRGLRASTRPSQTSTQMTL
jgi:hypothetical protein